MGRRRRRLLGYPASSSTAAAATAAPTSTPTTATAATAHRHHPRQSFRSMGKHGQGEVGRREGCPRWAGEVLFLCPDISIGQ
uniref:Putative secreted protein n=1 Tax=Anopheles darlingi TaxID=43151 RepID=A0A2M4DEZ1_ANODA